MTGRDHAPDLLANLRDSLRTCPKTAREGRYLLTCCRPVGHDGDCWCSDIRLADDEDGAGDE